MLKRILFSLLVIVSAQAQPIVNPFPLGSHLVPSRAGGGTSTPATCTITSGGTTCSLTAATVNGAAAAYNVTTGVLTAVTWSAMGTSTPTCTIAAAIANDVLCSISGGGTGPAGSAGAAGAIGATGAAGTNGAISVIQDEGTPLTVQPFLNFIGPGVTCVNNGGSTRTDCTFVGAGVTVAADATGSTTTYTSTGIPAPSSLTNGLAVDFIPQATNTGPSTLNLNSLGAKSIVYTPDRTVVASAGLQAGSHYLMIYDSSTSTFGFPRPGVVADGSSTLIFNYGASPPTSGVNLAAVPLLTSANAFSGLNTFPTFNSTTNCSSGASPAVCVAASAGSVAIPAGTNSTLVVNTTAVTANSQIFLIPDDTLGTRLSVTCNSTLASLVGGIVVTARTAATSFTITLVGTTVTNPACVSFLIVN